MSETYRIKFDRRGLPGSMQSRITKPYTLEDLHTMFSAYMSEGLIVDLSPREVKLVETAAAALEKLQEMAAMGEQGSAGEQPNPLLDCANAEIKRLREALEKAAGALDDAATDLRVLSRIDNC